MKLIQATILTLTLTLLPSASFAIDAEQANLSTMIFNGSDVTSKDFTYYAQLIIHEEGSSQSATICGASVVNDFFILTAAHCVEDYDADNLRVVTKNQTRSFFIDEFRTIKSITVHPSWNGVDDGFLDGDDLAVIELNYPILDNISSMRLATESDTDKAIATEKLKIIGMGQINNYNFPSTLQQGDMLSVSNEDCNNSNNDVAQDELICATPSMVEENALANVCGGDSGGPLLYFDEDEQRYQQVGIVSFGFHYCQFTDYDSSFTKTSYYNEWLTSIITYGSELTYDATIEDGNPYSTGEDGTFMEDNDVIDDVVDVVDVVDDVKSSSSGGSTSLVSLCLLALITIRRKTMKVK